MVGNQAWATKRCVGNQMWAIKRNKSIIDNQLRKVNGEQ
jgi:hypothetical protein